MLDTVVRPTVADSRQAHRVVALPLYLGPDGQRCMKFRKKDTWKNEDSVGCRINKTVKLLGLSDPLFFAGLCSSNH